MPPSLREGHGAVYSLPFGTQLRSDIHVRGRQPAHTVPGSLLPIIAYVTVFIIADIWIIPRFFEKCNRNIIIFLISRFSSGHLSLSHYESVVYPLLPHQLVMCAAFCDLTLVEHGEKRCVSQG